MGPFSVTATDCNGCTGTWAGFVMVTTTSGCMDPAALNYNPSANADCAGNAAPTITNPGYGDTSCCIPIINGCMDSTAYNYNATATLDDGSCFYCSGANTFAANMRIEVPAVTTGIGQGPEIGWIIKDASGAVVDTGGVIPLTQFPGILNQTVGTPYPAYMDTSYDHMVCLEWGCYTIELYDAWGDGWGGPGASCTYSLVDDITGFVYASGALVHTGLAPYTTFTAVDSVCMNPCSPFSLSVSTITDASCAGGSDGDIEINPLPGATYSWSNGATGTYISGLSAGTYTV
jgi:hypothetical protein